MILLSESFKT